MMDLTEHKIRGIDIDVCSCEKKIAYNICLSIYERYTPIFNWLIVDAYLPAESSGYNRDIIKHYVMFNLESYSKLSTHIFLSYDEIGKAFINGYKKIKKNETHNQ